MKLSKEETLLLKEIMEDKYARGPFAGMIFNAHIGGGTVKPIDELIQRALQVRLRLDELASPQEPVFKHTVEEVK